MWSWVGMGVVEEGAAVTVGSVTGLAVLEFVVEEAVLEELVRRASSPPGGEDSPALLPETAPALDAQQRSAVAAVLRYGLVLLEGGPGTGKTSTVAAMLAALLERHPGARIHLAAPTGKAAARLRAATGAAWPCTTVHRLLESRGESFGRHPSSSIDCNKGH